jgi:hypothetical protein
MKEQRGVNEERKAVYKVKKEKELAGLVTCEVRGGKLLNGIKTWPYSEGRGGLKGKF